MVTIFPLRKSDLVYKNFYPQTHLNALAIQDRDKHHRIRYSKKIPSALVQKNQNTPTYMLEGSYKRRTKSFITKLSKPLPFEIVQEQSIRSKFNSLVSRKLKPLYEIYNHKKFQGISKNKYRVYPYVIEEIIDEETDEDENGEKGIFTWRKTPDPRKKYLNSLCFEFR
ncbi:hypothetical protein SteCoe_2514 [Stentor coeruleus]|uniref:Uncharacterized protein n=1 Tax=Stentor coeruleus TaxID=5963 RepID=A0A1R2CZ94_9CILI|nr:hypothetical protein SteCoe_2514 [Stentor coeruleus]